MDLREMKEQEAEGKIFKIYTINIYYYNDEINER
jgi:hypothetical protein